MLNVVSYVMVTVGLSWSVDEDSRLVSGEHFYKIWIIADDWEVRVRNNAVHEVAVRRAIVRALAAAVRCHKPPQTS